LGHHRHGRCVEQALDSRAARALIGHVPHFLTSRAERSLQPIWERHAIQVALFGDEPPPRLRQSKLVEQTSTLDLALCTLERGDDRDRDR
jgi:hypothetical protein